MSRLIVLLLFFGIIAVNASETDSIETKQIVVTGQRIPYLYKDAGRKIEIIDSEMLRYSAHRSINDIFEMSGGVDLRERGAPGMQADLSVRGSNANQVAVLLDGIPVNDPQTGHHNLNIPVDYNSIDRVEMLSGPGARTTGMGAFAGAVNILTRSPAKERVSFDIAGGENEYFKLSGNASWLMSGLENFYSMSFRGAGPYVDNTDYHMGSFLYKGGYSSDGTGRFGLILSGAFRNFGANSFYTSLFPEQYEETMTALAAIIYSSQTENPLEIKAFWRHNRDHFELFRYDSPDWYTSHNNHRTNIYGAMANYSIEWTQGISSFGAEVKSEHLLSNVLGSLTGDSIAVPGYDDAFYTRGDNRQNASFFIEHSMFTDIADVSTGLMLNWYSSYGWDVTGGIDLSIKIINRLHAIATLNNGMRLPTFTEMYYSGPTNRGNPALEPERSVSFEAGIKYTGDKLDARLTAFNRQGRNIIDWVRLADSLMWESMNLTELNTTGLDASVQTASAGLPGLSGLRLEYSRFGIMWIFSEKSSEEYESYYAMDYLRFKAYAGFALGYGDATLAGELRYEERAGKYYDTELDKDVPYEAYFVADMKFMQKIFGAEIYLEISNVFDKKYYDIAHVPLPGRWIRAGLAADIDI
jgi:iron complex outermembrane receptor protein